MIEDAEWIKKGIAILRKFASPREFVIGIENNKMKAINHLKEVFKDESDVKVLQLESVYPQGAKQVLLWNATHKVVKAGERLASLGVIITNVTTLSKMAQYFETGLPLVSKTISLDGSAIKNKGNYIVPIGTSFSYVIEATGGFSEKPVKVIDGGPMMGKAVDSLATPVVKATSAIVAFGEKESEMKRETVCIHCGKCISACPLNLNPWAFSDALEETDEEKRTLLLRKTDVNTCMECGCCAFVCPAHRPLVENNRKGKAFLRGRNN